MANKQPEALRIADYLMELGGGYDQMAAAELRRLHEEVQQWQEKCNTYIEIHDAVVKDNERLHEVNAELVESLKYCREKIAYMTTHGEWYSPGRAIEKADAALAKAQGDNNG